MSKAPAFQFYANDFMDATRFWEANAVGLYVRCLCIQWTHGSIPSDLKALSRGLGCDLSELQTCWPILSEKFAPGENGGLVNAKLEAVRARQNEISRSRSEAGILGANAKANAKQMPQHLHQQRKVKEKEKVEGEGKGENEVEVNQQRARKPEIEIAAPEAIADHWQQWLAHRREIRKPMTTRAQRMMLKQLEGMGHDRARRAIEHSIANGWQGIYEPQQAPNGTQAKRPQDHTRDERRAEILRLIAEQHGQPLAGGGNGTG